MTTTGPVVATEDLVKEYPVRRHRGNGGPVRALDGVTLEVERGTCLAVVGESGSGKSTLARCILGLTQPSAGSVRIDGVDIGGFTEAQLRPYRRRMQVIFQDPRASFDPRMSIGRSVTEPLRVHRIGDRATHRDEALRLMELVGLGDVSLDRHPHELSGGQLQRLAIARALMLEPEILICDEPVSALDVSIQAQIITLLRDLQQRLGLSYLFIAHDLGVVSEISHQVAVILAGRIVEQGATEDVLARPRHEYTRRLIEASLPPRPGAGRVVPRRKDDR